MVFGTTLSLPSDQRLHRTPRQADHASTAHIPPPRNLLAKSTCKASFTHATLTNLRSSLKTVKSLMSVRDRVASSITVSGTTRLRTNTIVSSGEANSVTLIKYALYQLFHLLSALINPYVIEYSGSSRRSSPRGCENGYCSAVPRFR